MFIRIYTHTIKILSSFVSIRNMFIIKNKKKIEKILKLEYPSSRHYVNTTISMTYIFKKKKKNHVSQYVCEIVCMPIKRTYLYTYIL